MNQGQLWAEVAQAALNYIVVNSLTNAAQGRTVMDMKTDLRTTKEDLLAEVKEIETHVVGILRKELGNDTEQAEAKAWLS